MIKKIINFFRGYLLIKITGNALERFISQIINSGINLWDVERVDEDHYRAKIYADDFNRLRPILRKRLCRVRILRRKGCFALLQRMKRRYLLVIGLILFLAVFWISSSFLWFISIEGLDQIPEEKIYYLLNEAGARSGVMKDSLNLTDIEKRLLKQEPRIAWLDLKWQGTRLKVEIVEKKIVDKNNQGDIIAARDGIITELIILNGQPLVEEGDTVTRGQELIRAIKEENSDEKRASGIARARVWYEGTGSARLQVEEAVYTGREKYVVGFQVGSNIYRLQPPPLYNKYILERKAKTLLKWRNYNIPLEIITEEYKEVKYFTYKQNKKIALFKAKERALDRVLDQIDDKAVITDVRTEIKETRNEIKVRVLIQSEENIAIKEDFSD